MFIAYLKTYKMSPLILHTKEWERKIQHKIINNLIMFYLSNQHLSQELAADWLNTNKQQA